MMLRLAILLWAAAASAQPPATRFAPDGGIQRLPLIEKQDIRFDGLSVGGKPFQKRVFAVAQDNYGFLWLGTDDGLYRYDGHNLRHYSHEPGNPNSLTENTVMQVYKDRAGILWIGTAYGGLDRFDPAADKFTHYRHDPNDSQSLRNDYIAELYQDRTGAMWVDTVDGFDRLDLASGRFFHYPDPVEEIELRHVVREFYEDSQGNLLVGYAQGLYKMDRASGRLSRIWNSPRSAFSSSPNLGVQWLPGRGGMAWFTSLSENMIGGVNTDNGECRCYAPPWDGAHTTPSKEYHRIYEDRSGQLWIGSRRGLFQLDKDRKSFVRYADQPDRGMGGLIWALLEDSEGNLWVGSEAGLSRFQTTPSAFVNYRTDAGNPNELRINKVLSVLSDTRGSLWVGTNAGLHRLDRKTGQVVRYQNNIRDTHSISHNTVTAIKDDGTGRLWIGTQGGGLNHFDPASGRFVVYRHNPLDSQSLSSDDIRGLTVEPGGSLWAATVGGGVSRFDPGTGHFKTYRNDPRTSGTLSHDVVFAVFMDRTGTLWVGTFWGLNRFNRDTGRFTVYLHDEHNRASLSNDGITSIYEDHQGALWIGTRAGLDRFDRNRDSFEAITTQNGLANDFIQDIREDGRGKLWLTTHEGLSEFDPRTGKVHNYSEADGLPGNFVNPTMTERSAVTSEGELIFGSEHGLTVFSPDRVSANPYVPPVLLTEFLLFNKSVIPSRDSPLHEAIWATHTLTLNHEQSNLTLEFAALSYVAPERNRYRYKLENFEKEWSDVGQERHVASYTALPPGKYVFRVQGSNNDLVWNEAGVNLAITVLPPWYETWLFRSVAATFVIALIVAAYRLRVRNLQMTAARLERKVAQRTRELEAAKESAENANRAKSVFLSHMNHELRTPLNAILGFANLLREDGVTEKQRTDLDVIHRSGEHLLGLIDDVLDIAKIEAGRVTVEIAACDLRRLLLDVTDMMRVRAAEKNLELRYVEASEIPQFVQTDAPKLRQMLINLLGNAVKYTQKGRVTLRLFERAAHNSSGVAESSIAGGQAAPGTSRFAPNGERQPGSEQVLLVIEVEDTGIGISPEDQERIFEPFVQVGDRLRQKGTGLGLSITRQFAALLGGTLRVSSTPGEGSLFHLEIPVTIADQSAADPVVVEREYILEAGQQEYRVLVVDDSSENRELLQRLLHKAGFQVRVVEGGEGAVETFQDWQPQFIWMDLRMPGMDGAEATRRIRTLERGHEVKIVAVTASENMSVRPNGMDGLVHKPYRTNEIFDCMADQLGVRYCDAAPRPFAESPAILRPEALAALPDDLRAELARAVVRLDLNEINSVIRRVSELDAELGAALTFHLDGLALTQVLEALQECNNTRVDV